MEAFTFGQTSYLTILTFDNPKEAMERRPALKVAFLQLLAILNVEESLSRGYYTEKREAWEGTQPRLENVPQRNLQSANLLKEIVRSLNQTKQRYATIKAIQDSKNKSESPKSWKPCEQARASGGNQRPCRK
ncbi:hypothetical protein BWQ96_06216 [Gracilariopsis chorda]|uniref:Uncharacterized protein n=1 Tax=Gracilariopsis chorda TaxID=448386 RepID=A0A2V3IPR0_9FLOR|nr:hypothetical protein BWQ96_06216 [Gracilariopsis chorda]|eukprot:PXF44043.1 hypothetical protein BWQ96_06216 [Gracilariopsis chorda]